jgi:hypothetical protein
LGYGHRKILTATDAEHAGNLRSALICPACGGGFRKVSSLQNESSILALDERELARNAAKNCAHTAPDKLAEKRFKVHLPGIELLVLGNHPTCLACTFRSEQFRNRNRTTLCRWYLLHKSVVKPGRVWVSEGVGDLVPMLRIGQELKKSITSFADNEGAYREVFRNCNWHRGNPNQWFLANDQRPTANDRLSHSGRSICALCSLSE